MSRRGFWSWVSGFDFIDWILAILVVGAIVGGIGESIDWLDQRACRVEGGHIVRDGRDWRCEARR